MRIRYSEGYRKWMPRLLVLLMVMDVWLAAAMVAALVASAEAGRGGGTRNGAVPLGVTPRRSGVSTSACTASLSKSGG